ncbi:hypothetical protein IE53DRAFT_147887 [Violaceomyces palustris]|uniref:Uncharacterized protein n=1 Tax=Violaceomyces palustris TaxID=1673888 RepID=A0ACD0NU89_9BASI|nr:hypothetical protein IE53DRAFT_147887 [Violaceomyces palustris]
MTPTCSDSNKCYPLPPPKKSKGNRNQVLFASVLSRKRRPKAGNREEWEDWRSWVTWNEFQPTSNHTHPSCSTCNGDGDGLTSTLAQREREREREMKTRSARWIVLAILGPLAPFLSPFFLWQSSAWIVSKNAQMRHRHRFGEKGGRNRFVGGRGARRC